MVDLAEVVLELIFGKCTFDRIFRHILLFRWILSGNLINNGAKQEYLCPFSLARVTPAGIFVTVRFAFYVYLCKNCVN